MKRFTKPAYPPEFRKQMIDLMRAGEPLNKLGRDFDVNPTTLLKWRRQADQDDGVRADGLKTDEKTELARLRRENETLREERDILKKAAAWFAQEAVPTHKGRSGS